MVGYSRKDGRVVIYCFIGAMLHTVHNARFRRLTSVAAPMALPTTAQYIFCSVKRLGAPLPMDIEPMGMSVIRSMLGGGCD